MKPPNFDSAKTPLEKRVDKAVAILEYTYPEQISDAMSDYAKVLRALEGEKDYRIQDIIMQLKELYVLPNRHDHNKLIQDLHKTKEDLQEARIEFVLEKQQSLGEVKQNKNNKLWVLIAIISLYILLK